MGDAKTSLASMNFEDDFKAATEAPDATRWTLEKRGDLEIWVTVHPAGHEQDTYVARLLWSDYPGNLPPSVKFVDPATGRLDSHSAWPKANGFRPTSLDICANWTAEGFSVHPEWLTTTDRWNPRGNVILKAVRTLQSELDNSYTGRFDG